jgi:AraC family transcriptional regulator, transcriptional activator of pobA
MKIDNMTMGMRSFNLNEDHLQFSIRDLTSSVILSEFSCYRFAAFEIVIIESGASMHFIDENKITVRSKEILCIPKGGVRSCNFTEVSNGYILSFFSELFSAEQYNVISKLEIFSPYLKSKLLVFDDGSWREMIELFNVLNLQFLKFKSGADKSCIRHLLLAFCIKIDGLGKATSHGDGDKYSNLCCLFIECLETNYRKQHSAKYYSFNLNCTSRQLSKLLVRTFGKATQKLITDRIILEAKRELIYSDRSIKELAWFLGFEDQLYFTKVFKKITQISPLKFRKKYFEKLD